MSDASASSVVFPRLTRALLASIDPGALPDVAFPPRVADRLGERAIAFGTGALLRGLVAPLFDEAARTGRLAGRMVMVASTDSGRDRAINEQDGLYTLVVRGILAGEPVERLEVVGSVTRALSAAAAWSDVLATAHDPGIDVVFSNTTEVGIVLDEDDDLDAMPPRSFPGKLARWLVERGVSRGFDAKAGVVVLPCELIEANGDRLREIVLSLASRSLRHRRAATWIEQAVTFANTLVDRIVPGAPPADVRRRLGARLGWTDALAVTCEPYRLLAIEGDELLAARLSWLTACQSVVVARDITPYRERKVRLLNGAHTLLAPLGLLLGHDTVGDAVRDLRLHGYLRRVMFGEVLPTLDVPDAHTFACDVLERFANPFIRHALVDITLQGTMKLRVRVVPSLLATVAATGRVPPDIAFGMAATLFFLRGDLQEARRRAGLSVPVDDLGARVRAAWFACGGEVRSLVDRVLRDGAIWGQDLDAVPGVSAAVCAGLEALLHDGPAAALARHLELEGVGDS